MDIEGANPHVVKILIAARMEDSVNAIAKRTGLSYGWAYRWVQELIKEGVFARKAGKLVLQEKSRFYVSFMLFVKNTFACRAAFHYYVLRFFGVKYCFTKTDAVYVWTGGGYNIARYRDYYPVFIKLKKSDYDLFRWYCKKVGLKINADSGVFYAAGLMDDFPVAEYNGIPVDSLEETVGFMKEHIYNFEPALEMVYRMHGAGEEHAYREAETNV